MGWRIIAAAALTLMGGGSAARAACEPPKAGTSQVSGIVRAAAGGGTLCIQTGQDDIRLVRVRLSDVTAPRLTGPGGEGAKWALRRAARGQRVMCVMDPADPGAGVCRIGGRLVSDLLKTRP